MGIFFTNEGEQKKWVQLVQIATGLVFGVWGIILTIKANNNQSTITQLKDISSQLVENQNSLLEMNRKLEKTVSSLESNLQVNQERNEYLSDELELSNKNLQSSLDNLKLVRSGLESAEKERKRKAVPKLNLVVEAEATHNHKSSKDKVIYRATLKNLGGDIYEFKKGFMTAEVRPKDHNGNIEKINPPVRNAAEFPIKIPDRKSLPQNAEIKMLIYSGKVPKEYYETFLFFEDVYGVKYAQKVFLWQSGNNTYKFDLGRMINKSNTEELNEEIKKSYKGKK